MDAPPGGINMLSSALGHVGAINGHKHGKGPGYSIKSDSLASRLQVGAVDPSHKRREATLQLLGAVQTGKFDGLRYLVEKEGASVNAQDHEGKTALIYAARVSRFDILQYLVEEAKADIDVKDKHGWTALSYANLHGKKEVIDYLERQHKTNRSSVVQMELKADPGDPTQNRILLQGADEGNEELTREAVERGASIHAKDSNGANALIVAVLGRGNTNYIKFLVEEMYVNVDAKDKMGRTPLIHAVRMGKFDLMKYLVESAKSNVDAKDGDGWTALTHAHIHSRTDYIKYLVEEGKATFTNEEARGWTDPILARNLGKSDVVLSNLLQNANVKADATLAKDLLSHLKNNNGASLPSMGSLPMLGNSPAWKAVRPLKRDPGRSINEPRAKRKRVRRVSNACERCNAHKIRCEATRPCGPCVRKGFGNKCRDFIPLSKNSLVDGIRMGPNRQKRLADHLNPNYKKVACTRHPDCTRPLSHPGHCKIPGRRTVLKGPQTGKVRSLYPSTAISNMRRSTTPLGIKVSEDKRVGTRENILVQLHNKSSVSSPREAYPSTQKPVHTQPQHGMQACYNFALGSNSTAEPVPASASSATRLPVTGTVPAAN